MAARVPARLTAKEGRRFGFTVGAAFLVLGGLLWWRARLYAASVVGGLGILLFLSALLLPGRLGPVYRAWMGLAVVLSYVTTPVLLGVLYFFVFTPIGLVRRALGGNPLRRTQWGASGWVSRRGQAEMHTDMTRQF